MALSARVETGAGVLGVRRNATRQSASVPARLAAEGAWHLLPLYWLLTLSDLGREGIANSGSYRFADHIYRAAPSGRFVIGRLVDAVLLRLPAARAFRERYRKSSHAMHMAIARRGAATPTRILSVPCGIPRDIVDVVAGLQAQGDAPHGIDYWGMDIDAEVLRLARRVTSAAGLASARYQHGDALRREHYPDASFDAVVSTGLGEFLDDGELEAFYRNVYDVLAPGGTFFTSATAEDRRSEPLLRMIELRTHYRTAAQLRSILARLPWRSVEIEVDPTGLQAFATVRR